MPNDSKTYFVRLNIFREGEIVFLWNKNIEVMALEIKCRLRVIFAEREMKSTEFAKKVGISASALSLLVNGRSLPTLPVAYRIAGELGLNVEEIWQKK